jgi:formylglycine-generating enzyme required for sulfatase activity
MKIILAGSLLLACSLVGRSQNSPNAKPPAKGPAAVTTAATTDDSTNQPDIKELIKGPSFTNSIGMVMVKISPTFWAGKFLVTQEEYKKVVHANPSEFQGARNPVDSVSWNDAMSFCAQLTETERKEKMLPEGGVYTLPTQAQWESLAAGAALENAVTSLQSPRKGTEQVGSLGPSPSGLYDIRGNLWEWCLDPDDKAFRVLKGGAWDTSLDLNMRPEFRWYSNGPDERKNIFGLRCVLVGQ